MSSSISNTTQQQPGLSPQQRLATAEPSAKPDAGKSAPDPTSVSKQQSAVVGQPASALESKSHRNNDGTYGPNHSITAPFNPASATKPSNASPKDGVDIKI